MEVKLKPKFIDLESGGKNIVIINTEDAKDIDVSALDRVYVRANGKKVTALVDTSSTMAKQNEIGLFKEVQKELHLTKEPQSLSIEKIDKPKSVYLIRKKMDKVPLKQPEIESIIEDVMNDNLSEIELTAFVTAVYINGLNEEETLALTNEIIKSGRTLHFPKKVVLDKHSIGGVPGNRTTMLLVPIIASAGLTIPKTSSRAITSPAGTADVMEVLAPVNLTEKQIIDTINKTNGCIVWGGSMNLAAADDKLIKVRHPLSLDPHGMLLASILAKKKAVGSTHVLIDISIGKGAKIFLKQDAEKLADEFIRYGNLLNMNVECIITPGYDPIGQAIGPALEAREILRILEGENVSPELKEKGIAMAGLMLEMAGRAKHGEGEATARSIIDSGKALEKMKEIIKAQGGDPSVSSKGIRIGKKSMTIKATQAGRIHYMNTRDLSTIARAAGAPKDIGAGIYLYVEKGDKITKGQNIFTIYAESDSKLKAAEELIDKLQPVELEKTIIGTVFSKHKS
ncbi:MAG: AMP phosphorylase [DPANN group archaeon]|nr:AMP phosphorylase [DPANN group archaeon]